MCKRLTRDEFISRATQIHQGKFSYEKVEYIDTVTKVVITCNIHEDFSQTPTGHLEGKGCMICGRIRRGATRSSKASVAFKDKARLIHGEKYSYEVVKYISAITKVSIECREHGHFWQTPNSHLLGKGCPSCAKTGFQRSNPASLYVLITDGGFVGFGITGRLRQRLKLHKKNLLSHNIKIIYTFVFSGRGEDILLAEQHIKATHANSNVFIEGFKTEAFTDDRLGAVLEYLRSITLLKELLSIHLAPSSSSK